MTQAASSLLAALALAAAGCAMSRESLEQLEAEVLARNAARRATAGAELTTEGYVDAQDEVRRAALSDADRERCLTREPGDAPMRVALDGAPPLAVSAVPSSACAFFRGRAVALATRSEDGRDVTLHALAGFGLMRAPGGERVLVRFDSRIVETHRPLVDMDCDHMPQVEPDPLEYGSAVVGVVVAPERPREVTRELEREVVDARCTRNTY